MNTIETIKEVIAHNHILAVITVMFIALLITLFTYLMNTEKTNRLIYSIILSTILITALTIF